MRGMSKEGRNPRIKNFKKRTKSVDNASKNGYNKSVKWKNRLTLKKLQVSPSGMAAASQAVPGEFDSRHLLQVSIIRTICLQQANGSDLLFYLD